MDRKQREALVVAMRENGKSYRDIAQELKMSPNSIKAISNKAGLDESTSMSSRAFDLFSHGQTPLEVAIKLNREADEVIRLHQQYFMLLGCIEFTKVYLQIKDDPWPFVNLMRLAKEKQMDATQVVKLLLIANNDLPLAESKYENLKKEIESLECNKSRLAKDYQQLCDGISSRNGTVNQLRSTIEQLQYEEAKLNLQKQQTESFVKTFQNNNEICIKIRDIVKQQMGAIIAQPKHLLRIAIASIFESERKNRGKLRALYYNTCPTLSVEQIISFPSISQNEQQPKQFGYNDDSLERLLLDEAEQLYNRIAEALTGKCMNEITIDTELVTSIPQLPEILPNQSTHAIPEASEGEITVSTIMNNITSEICNTLNLINERGRGTKVTLKDDESDTQISLRDQLE